MTAQITEEQQANLFNEVETAQTGLGTRTTWTGVLSLQIPSLGLTSEYHLRAGKAKGNAPEVDVRHIDKTTGQQCESKEVVRLYRYQLNPDNTRTPPVELSYEEAKAKVRYDDDGEWLVSAKQERRYFDSVALAKGSWTEIPLANVADIQDGEEVSPFERTNRLEIGPEDFVPLARATEYASNGTYMLGANIDKKVKEQSGRVRDLARTLLEKQVALLTGFVWKKGYKFYTTLIFPYEEPKSGKLWLLMRTTDGILRFDPAWTLEDTKPEEATIAAPTAKKPRMVLTK